MKLIKQLSMLLESAQEYLNTLITQDKVVVVEPKKKQRKKGDYTPLTTEQLLHLQDVYTNKKEGISGYSTLVDYANEVFNLNKTHAAYYKALVKFEKTLHTK